MLRAIPMPNESDQNGGTVEQRVQELLQKLVSLPRTERPTFLKQSCEGDPHLGQFVESLVSAAMAPPTIAAQGGGGKAVPETIDATPEHDGPADNTFSFAPRPRSSSAVQTPTLDPSTHGDAPESEAGSVYVPPPKVFKDPDRIGPYRMLEVVGEGGFGTVWVAEQQAPVRRRVALKIIRPGMDSRAVVARFEQERQALAMMDHPNIAKVFDAGTAPDGRPFFVMEFVAGEPITDFCDRNRQSIRQRLELFIKVCEAVQHAHHKGIIHRDLKPSNVLVSSGESGPVVKVIDFGVAKAMSQVLTDKTLFTEQGQILGTPEYMSPEQAEMGVLDIDTRTDVYALGVMLYELLTGALPFEPRDLRSQGYVEIQRIIKEVDPPRPSVRLQTMAQALSQEVAKQRMVKYEELASQLRKELEWIPLKAMRKEREQRYASPMAMADDIRNHLEGRPLVAGPETYRYRARKFVVRNKWAVAFTSALTVAIVAGLVASSIGFVKASRSARVARTEVERQRAVTKYEASLLASVGAASGDPKNVTVRELLDGAVQKLDAGGQADQPHVESALRAGLARSYRSLSLWSASEAQWRKALELEGNTSGDDTVEAANVMSGLAQVLTDTNRYDEAEKLLDRVLMIQREQLPPNDQHLGDTLNAMGLLKQYKADTKSAEARYREALAVYGNNPDAIVRRADALTNLAQLIARTRPGEGLDLATQAMELRRKANLPVEVWNSEINLGQIYELAGDLAGAERYRREAMELSLKLFDEKNRKVVQSMNALARTLWLKNDARSLEEAQSIQTRALELAHAIDGDKSLDIAQGIDLLGCIARDRGDLPRAIELFREALRMRTDLQKADHPATAGAMAQLADALTRAGQTGEAVDLATRALEIRKAKLQPGDWTLANTASILGGALTAAGDYAKAEPLLLEAQQTLKGSAALAGRPRREVNERLVTLYEKWGKPAEAEKWRLQQ